MQDITVMLVAEEKTILEREEQRFWGLSRLVLITLLEAINNGLSPH